MCHTRSAAEVPGAAWRLLSGAFLQRPRCDNGGMRSPMLFISHGAPSAATETSGWHEALARWGAANRPEAAIVVSAHSGSRRWNVGSNPAPQTIHDYFGFPAELYAIRWAAAGSPALAAEAVGLLTAAGHDASEDPLMGLDHGIWVPLRAAWPDAGIPIIPLTVPIPSDPRLLTEAGQALAPLRDQGVMLIGTGGIVHNLQQLRMSEPDAEPDSWAVEFDRWVVDRLRSRSYELLLEYQQHAPAARLAVPTPEHLDPLFFVMGAMQKDDELQEIYRGIRYGNLALTTLAFAA